MTHNDPKKFRNHPSQAKTKSKKFKKRLPSNRSLKNWGFTWTTLTMWTNHPKMSFSKFAPNDPKKPCDHQSASCPASTSNAKKSNKSIPSNKSCPRLQVWLNTFKQQTDLPKMISCQMTHNDPKKLCNHPSPAKAKSEKSKKRLPSNHSLKNQCFTWTTSTMQTNHSKTIFSKLTLNDPNKHRDHQSPSRPASASNSEK